MIARKLSYIFSSLLLVLFLTSNAFAATYYVRTDGTKGSKGTTACNSGSASDFMDETDIAGETFGGTDTIVFCNDGGDYNNLPIFINNNGTDADNRLTFECETGDGAVTFDNPSWPARDSTSSHIHFVIDGASYLIFDGKDTGTFESGQRAFSVEGETDSDYVTIKNWTSTNQREFFSRESGATTDYFTIGGADGDGNTISGQASNDTGDSTISFGDGLGHDISYNEVIGSVSPAYGTDAILISNNNDPTSWSESIKIHHNKMYNSYRENEIDIKGSRYIEIYDNEMYGTVASSTTSGQVNIQSSTDIKIYRNYIHDDNCTTCCDSNNRCNAITINDSETNYTIKNVDEIEIFGNVIANMSGYGIAINQVNGKIGTIRIYNNTFYDSTDDMVWADSLSQATDSEMKNNIFMEIPSGKCAFKYTASDWGGGVSNNLYYDAGDNVYNAADNGSCDDLQSENNPLFTDASNHDFTIQEGSPAIDQGVVLGDPYDEIIIYANFDADPPIVNTASWEDVPAGEYPDIGAWEYIFNAGK
jgi:hypothetical protein